LQQKFINFITVASYFSTCISQDDIVNLLNLSAVEDLSKSLISCYGWQDKI